MLIRRGPIAAGLLALLLGAACERAAPPAAAPPPFRSVDPSALSGERALKEVADFVNLGPKVAGTPELEKAALHVQSRLQALGVAAEIESFEDDSPKGRITVRNVIGRLPGKRPGRIILGSHFDTKDIPDFVGANDGGSSTGLLLEIARVLRTSGWEGPELWLAFFDGEEALVRYVGNDGLHGSRHLAARLKAEGKVDDTRAMVLLDMVGDRDLGITLPADTRPALARLVFDCAEFLRVREKFGFAPTKMVDDHLPFQELGIPAVDFIDFKYGSRPGWNDYWHTPRDTLDKLSAESLQTVGRVTIELLNRLAALDGRP